MKSWLFLLIAIVSEVIATTALKLSEGFSRLWPSAVTVIGYGLAFYFLSLTLRTIPVGVVYAVWSGLGIALITALAWFMFDEKLDWPALAGLGLIILGIVVLNAFSKSAIR